MGVTILGLRLMVVSRQIVAYGRIIRFAMYIRARRFEHLPLFKYLVRIRMYSPQPNLLHSSHLVSHGPAKSVGVMLLQWPHDDLIQRRPLVMFAAMHGLMRTPLLSPLARVLLPLKQGRILRRLCGRR